MIDHWTRTNFSILKIFEILYIRIMFLFYTSVFSLFQQKYIQFVLLPCDLVFEFEA